MLTYEALEELSDRAAAALHHRGRRTGRFGNTPTPAQALHLARRGTPDLSNDLSPYTCRLTLLGD